MDERNSTQTGWGDTYGSSELLEWLSVDGDMDDFIYYGENEKRHSER